MGDWAAEYNAARPAKMYIRVESLSKRYGQINVLDGVPFEIVSGKIVAILGPHGAGKTTLFRSLATIVKPDEGQILYDGEKLQRDRLDVRKKLFFLPDFPLVFAEMTVLHHIIFMHFSIPPERMTQDDSIELPHCSRAPLL